MCMDTGSRLLAARGYSFFSAGGTAGGVAGGVAVGVTGGGVGAVAGVGAGVVTAPGTTSCQWPCSGDHTFPGGASPGGWGAGVNCCAGTAGVADRSGTVKACVGDVPTAAPADCGDGDFGLAKK
jgi:hypothetical protein